MKWRCPTCGTVWSIPDCDRGNWEGKTKCLHCPIPIKRVAPQIRPQTKSEPTIETEPKTEPIALDEDHLDILDENHIEAKAFVAESEKLGEVTDEPAMKNFRERGYEGKKQRRKKHSFGN